MRSKNKDRERGFALLGTALIVAIMVAAVSIAVRGSTEGLAQTASLRQAELAHAALSEGYSQVLNQIQHLDFAVDLAPSNPINWNIFDSQTPGVDYLNPAPTYPPAGHPFQNEFTLHTGLALGQRTQAPAGEDVRNSYGFIVEVELRAESTGIGAAAEERVTVGVQVPHQISYSK